MAGWHSALSYDGSGRLLAWFAVALACGAAIYFSLPAEPDPTGFAAIAAATMLSLLALGLTWRRGGVFAGQGLALLILTGGLCGFGVSALHTHARATPMLADRLDRVMVEGWIMAVEPHPTGVRLRLRVHAMSGWSQAQTPRVVRVTQRGTEPLYPGRFVRCYASLLPPPGPGLAGDHDFRITAYFEQLGAVGYVMGSCRPGALGPSIHHRQELALAALRRSISLRVEAAAGARAGGFAAGMVSGDRSLMDEADAEALRASGLAHILAISGMNLAIVGGLVYGVVRTLLSLCGPLALRIPVQKPAAAAALIVVTGYFILSGMTVAPQRAWIMSVVLFGAILLDRTALSLHSLSLALLATVLVHPAGVLTPGFQMSFVTTAVLIAAFAQWNGRPNPRGTPRPWWQQALAGALISSALGTLITIPIGLFHFDRTAPFGIVANLLAMPVISFVVAPGAGLALFLWPLGLQDYGLAVMGWGLDGVLSIAHWAADQGRALEAFTRQHTLSPAALCAFLFAIFLYTVHDGAGRWAALGVLILSGVLWLLTPQPRLHLTAKGQLYVASADGGWIDAAPKPHNRELPPLRYADLERHEPCTQPCEYALRGGNRLMIAPTAPACQPALPAEAGAATPAELSLPVEIRSPQGACIAAFHLTLPQDGLSATIWQDPSGYRVTQTRAARRPWTPQS